MTTIEDLVGDRKKKLIPNFAICNLRLSSPFMTILVDLLFIFTSLLFYIRANYHLKDSFSFKVICYVSKIIETIVPFTSGKASVLVISGHGSCFKATKESPRNHPWFC